MKKEIILAKLTEIINKIYDNSIEAWEDSLEVTKSVVVTEDFSKNLPDNEQDPELEIQYNGWLEELETLKSQLEGEQEDDKIPAKRDNKSIEESIDSASKLLCDNDELEGDSIHEQIKRIAAHPHQQDLIDNVDGVIVWEKVVGSFTCEEFLEYIDWN